VRDIPIFTTDWGTVSLSLGQIPYRKEAYVRIQACTPGHIREVVQECTAFCRAAGAEHIYATGSKELAIYPVHTELLRMEVAKSAISSSSAELRPVTSETAAQWRKIYNNRMEQVPNAAYMDLNGEKKLALAGDAYFIYDGEVLLGIGKASGSTVQAVATVKPGAGERIVCALSGVLSGDTVQLEVASSNARGMRLYSRMGFRVTEQMDTWYQIF
jgi:hypothetical protein